MDRPPAGDDKGAPHDSWPFAGERQRQRTATCVPLGVTAVSVRSLTCPAPISNEGTSCPSRSAAGAADAPCVVESSTIDGLVTASRRSARRPRRIAAAKSTSTRSAVRNGRAAVDCLMLTACSVSPSEPGRYSSAAACASTPSLFRRDADTVRSTSLLPGEEARKRVPLARTTSSSRTRAIARRAIARTAVVTRPFVHTRGHSQSRDLAVLSQRRC